MTLRWHPAGLAARAVALVALACVLAAPAAAADSGGPPAATRPAAAGRAPPGALKGIGHPVLSSPDAPAAPVGAGSDAA